MEKPINFNKNENSMRAVIYLRVSSDSQTENSQLNPCIDFIEKNNWKLVGIFKDHAKSAYHNVKRPEYDQIIVLVRKREIDHIIVWALDRWTRQDPKALEATLRFLESYGVKLHSVKESWIEDLHHLPAGVDQIVVPLVYNILAWVANKESQRRSERILDSIKFKKAKEKGLVGRPLISDDVIKQIEHYLDKGKSYRWIRKNITYTGKHGKYLHPSLGKITEIANQRSKKVIEIGQD